MRRIAIARIAQSAGISLAEVKEVLDRIPRDRAVGKAEWARAAEPWKALLDARIEMLMRLRDQMGYCIGCGCLSLTECPLYNADDTLGRNGPGARRWTGTEEERVALESE